MTTKNNNKRPPSSFLIGILFISLVLLGCLNFILYKVMFNTFGENHAFFVSQGVNVLFVIYGGLIVYPMQCFTNIITPEMKAISQQKYILMGLLDCFGTFFTAMGAVYTPGQIQTLLNQCLIPLTMIASRIFLQKSFYKFELLGASLIIVGASIVVLPSIYLNPFQPSSFRPYSCIIYVASNIPMACSTVYKEYAFKNYKVNVYYLTQFVSIYQLLFGFILGPLQTIPGIGSKNGTSLSQIILDFKSGYDELSYFVPLLLLLMYCFVNFVFNTAGLFMVKHASAIVNSMTYAVILPMTTICFSSKSLLGQYSEQLSIYTILGLIVVLSGLLCYHHDGNYNVNSTTSMKNATDETSRLLLVAPLENQDIRDDDDDVPSTLQGSFQERIVGMGNPHR